MDPSRAHQGALWGPKSAGMGRFNLSAWLFFIPVIGKTWESHQTCPWAGSGRAHRALRTHRAEALVGCPLPPLQPRPPLTATVGASGQCAEPRGGGKGLIICVSAGLQSTSSGEEVLLCWHPLEIKGGWWKWAGLRQPNLHACFITFASIDVEGGKTPKKP